MSRFVGPRLDARLPAGLLVDGALPLLPPYLSLVGVYMGGAHPLHEDVSWGVGVESRSFAGLQCDGMGRCISGGYGMASVQDHHPAVQPLLYLHLGMGIARWVQLWLQLKCPAREPEGVVRRHLAPVLEAEHPIQLQPSWGLAIGAAGRGRRYGDLGVEALKELLLYPIGLLRVGSRQEQSRHQQVLQGAEAVLNPFLGMFLDTDEMLTYH